MAAIFAECRRVLKPDGIMTLMFTHKATGAWDALTTGLMEAGFAIAASVAGSTRRRGAALHIRDKAAASSTVFLACRPRGGAAPTTEHTGAVRESRPPYGDDAESPVPPAYWEDVGAAGGRRRARACRGVPARGYRRG